MEKYNVSNMPMNTLYKFDDDKYVISLLLKETREGNYPTLDPVKFTEVYYEDSDGYMTRVASGKLIDNPIAFDYNKCFAIIDYDKDTTISFGVKCFEEAKRDNYSKMKDTITKNKDEKTK